MLVQRPLLQAALVASSLLPPRPIHLLEYEYQSVETSLPHPHLQTAWVGLYDVQPSSATSVIVGFNNSIIGTCYYQAPITAH